VRKDTKATQGVGGVVEPGRARRKNTNRKTWGETTEDERSRVKTQESGKNPSDQQVRQEGAVNGGAGEKHGEVKRRGARGTTSPKKRDAKTDKEISGGPHLGTGIIIKKRDRQKKRESEMLLTLKKTQ